MLTIRLIKIGKRNSSSFRVILVEKSAAPKSGKFLEILGNYDSRNKEINLEEERIKYWISKGAKTSETVHNLLVRKEIIKDAKIKKNIRKKKVPMQDRDPDSNDVGKEKEDTIKKE